jgi:hypothetical protein
MGYKFEVWLHGKKIDTVEYSARVTLSGVKDALIRLDGFDPAIRVKKARRRVFSAKKNPA